MIIKIMKIIKIIYQNEHCVLAQIDEDVNPAGTRNQIAKKTDWSSYKDTKEKGKQNNLLLWSCVQVQGTNTNTNTVDIKKKIPSKMEVAPPP